MRHRFNAKIAVIDNDFKYLKKNKICSKLQSDPSENRYRQVKSKAPTSMYQYLLCCSRQVRSKQLGEYVSYGYLMARYNIPRL